MNNKRLLKIISQKFAKTQPQHVCYTRVGENTSIEWRIESLIKQLLELKYFTKDLPRAEPNGLREIAPYNSQLINENINIQAFASSLTYKIALGLQRIFRKLPAWARSLLKTTLKFMWKLIKVLLRHPNSPNETITISGADTKSQTSTTSEGFNPRGPLSVFASPVARVRVNLVTPRIDDRSIMEPCTSLILSTLLANELDADLRIVTLNEKARPTYVNEVFKSHGINWHKNIEFQYTNIENCKNPIDISDKDLFITTSWESTQAVRGSINSSKIIYLIQEDEAMPYLFGDNHLPWASFLSDKKMWYVVKTKFLFDHLVQKGFANIKNTGLFFEPSLTKINSVPHYQVNDFDGMGSALGEEIKLAQNQRVRFSNYQSLIHDWEKVLADVIQKLKGII